MKNMLISFKNWLMKIKPSKRKIIQLYAALLYNANIKGFISGQIFKGDSKMVCVPGLNCYSCPGAIGACPLGSLQNGLSSAKHGLPYYVVGIIALYGLIFGRIICGYLCPMGFLQELLYMIKTPKIRKSNITRMLSYFKYILLVVLVLIIPLIYGLYDVVIPGFCKYICPAGIVEGAFGLLANPLNVDFFAMLGSLFTWKTLLLVGFATICVFMYRFFCRFICPLGALYGFFNRFSFLGITVNQDKCTNCGLCIKVCKMDVRKVGDHECINCGECISVCKTEAIVWRGKKPTLAASQIETKAKEVEINIENNEVINEITPQKKDYTKVKKITRISLATLLLAGTYVYANVIDKGTERVQTGNNIGDKCPDIELDLYNRDGTFKVSDNLGKVVVINFWATYCGPCILELPHFDEIQKKYQDEVYVVAIHSNVIDQDVEAFVNQRLKNYTIDFAQDAAENDLYTTLGGTGPLPMTFILDEESIICYKTPTSITYDELKTNIDLILEK